MSPWWLHTLCINSLSSIICSLSCRELCLLLAFSVLKSIAFTSFQMTLQNYVGVSQQSIGWSTSLSPLFPVVHLPSLVSHFPSLVSHLLSPLAISSLISCQPYPLSPVLSNIFCPLPLIFGPLTPPLFTLATLETKARKERLTIRRGRD